MNKAVASKFFKSTGSLPPDEQIDGKLECSLDAQIDCKGQIYIGKLAIYFYSQMNHLTFIGKSTKFRLPYADMASCSLHDGHLQVTLAEVK